VRVLPGCHPGTTASPLGWRSYCESQTKYSSTSPN
jgi:hypothetical protein